VLSEEVEGFNTDLISVMLLQDPEAVAEVDAKE